MTPERIEEAVPSARDVQDWSAQAHILVVDDEPDNLTLIEQALRGAGYAHITTVADPVRALTIAVEQRPDLLVVDLHMPKMDGLELLARLEDARPQAEYLATLLVTADMTRTTRERALGAGVKDFLTKPFDLTEVRLRVRNQLETAVLHRRLEDLVASRTQDLAESRLELLERLALAAEYRDDETHQHTRRVGLVCRELALLLGLPLAEAVRLERAAPLHDVGKIGVPDSVLLKPGPLDDAEMGVIREHPAIGARILGGSRFPTLQLAERIAMEHHERWDGTGYPRGLAGRTIAMPARIVAVADVFDALTHIRPYKPAWPVEAAVDELRRQRARHFDPEVLDVFLAGVAQGCFTFPDLEAAS